MIFCCFHWCSPVVLVGHIDVTSEPTLRPRCFYEGGGLRWVGIWGQYHPSCPGPEKSVHLHTMVEGLANDD
jgi:hypothetical protein